MTKDKIGRLKEFIATLRIREDDLVFSSWWLDLDQNERELCT
jgi:hypothetical protein